MGYEDYSASGACAGIKYVLCVKAFTVGVTIDVNGIFGGVIWNDFVRLTILSTDGNKWEWPNYPPATPYSSQTPDTKPTAIGASEEQLERRTITARNYNYLVN